MSDLSALQPTIFFASCTLKGLVWLPWYFLPELFLSDSTSGIEVEELEDTLLSTSATVQDHHLLLMERICHYTNIFALIGIVSFYAVNPRLFSYLQYGWLLTALLVLQHLPQLIFHEQWHTKLYMMVVGSTGTTKTTTTPTFDDDMIDDIYAATMDTPESDTTDNDTALPHPTSFDMLQTNRLFSTLGVLLVQCYALYHGHLPFIQRLAAEPMAVYLTLLTILVETHVVCLSAWYSHARHIIMTKASDSESDMDNLLGLNDNDEDDGGVHHISTHVSYTARLVLCTLLVVGILGAALFHRRVHAAQAKLLRNQLKTVKKKKGTSVAAKMKFV